MKKNRRVSLCLTAEIGDCDVELDCQHLEMKHYVPNQEYLDHKIIKLHKRHRYKETGYKSTLKSNIPGQNHF